MLNSLKDWPVALRINAAATVLAQALHVARSDAFGVPYVSWEDTPRSLREALIREATETLKRTQHMEVIIEKRA
jgi:hypothetical protein